MEHKKTVSLIGATGLVGSHLLELLQDDPDISLIKVLLRRSVSYDHPKVQPIVLDFSDQEAFQSGVAGSDMIFCAVGTTNKKVQGNKEAYRKVDYDIPVHAAKFGLETGCSQFLLISALGANSQSSNFYLQLKGETEEAIMDLGPPTVLIFRPSFLLGQRKEFRLGESVGILLAKPLTFLLPSKVKPITAHQVAQSMVAASKKDLKGHKIFHYKEMMELN
ncbi:MAG: NAD(P)H-binding protein [Bacteroidota bacterium]